MKTMPDDWAEVSSPSERVRTIAESMRLSRPPEWVAEQAEVDIATARDVLTQMVDDGELVTWTTERGRVFALNEGQAFVSHLRDIGIDTDEGILIPHEVVNELELSHD